MPNTDAVRIQPIADLLRMFMGRGDGWVDPFAESNSSAQYRNGLNAPHHRKATDFLARFPDESLQGVIFDANKSGDASSFGQVKDVAATKIVPGGLAVCCGSNSNGLGEGRGFELIHVLDVQHGGDHADTIVTVEIKVPYQAADDPTADDLTTQRSQEKRRIGKSRPKPSLPAAQPAIGRGGPQHDLQRAELLAVKDVAVLASLSESYLRRKIYSRELPATNIGTEARPVWRISRKDLAQWLEARKGGTPSIPPKSKMRDLIHRHLPGL